MSVAKATRCSFTMKVVGCVMEFGGKLLLLHRGEMEDESGTYSLVSGRVHEGETDTEAMIGEIKEETGYEANERELQYLKEFNWDFGTKKVDFPLYKLVLSQEIEVVHDPDEHQDFLWVTYEEAVQMDNLIHGLADVLKFLGYTQSSQ